MALECPDCEKWFTGKTCPHCGWKSTPGLGTPALPDPLWWRCAWTIGDRRCWMVGVYRVSAARSAYCEWHSDTMTMPQVRDSYDEFEAYVLMWRQRFCGQFSHDTVSDLQAAVLGYRPIQGKGSPCDDAACRHREQDIPATPLRPRLEIVRDIRGLIEQAGKEP